MVHATCFWFYSSIFRIQRRGRGRGQVASRSRNERLCRCRSSTHVRTYNDHCDRWSSMCFRNLSFYTCILSLERLEPRLKFQRAWRPKKRRGPANSHRRGLQRMAYHPLDGKSVQSMECHFCYSLCHCARFQQLLVAVALYFGRWHIPANLHIGRNFGSFISVASD